MSQRGESTVLPYHFVPVEAGPRADNVDVEQFRHSGSARLGHHRFVEKTRSGRILCRVTNESPIFIGAERQASENGSPADVTPFELAGRPAIPGSTLRGMISAIAEAASGSALRVLEDRVYSYRANMRNSLSAIGEVIVEKEGEDSRYSLRPITLPILENRSLRKEFRGWYSTPRLKAYVKKRDAHDDPLVSYRAAEPRYYGMRLFRDEDDEPLQWDDGEKLPDEGEHYAEIGRFLIAQRAPGKKEAPVPWEKIPTAHRKFYTRGIVRVMEDPESSRDLPDNRKWELFLPYDPDEAAQWKTFPILPEAVERFHQLADERTGAQRPDAGPSLPYEPVGTMRNAAPKDKDDRTFRLKTGDLVYFCPTEDGRAVAEIALSAIWRKRVEDPETREARKAWSFFETIDPELVPFHKDRRQITLAEQLFGFASEDDPEAETERLPALKSRLRFSTARLAENAAEPFHLTPCTLKILDSPKPPSPSLYFNDRKNLDLHIEKNDLNPGQHRPQGRKFYVHQRFEPGSKEKNAPWRTAKADDRSKMKTRIRPWRRDLEFYFHVDFENLSERELGLLLYALRPTESFRHKVGMGKPIGLGTVRLDVLGIFEIDRQQRYRSAGLFAPRYDLGSVASGSEPASWPASYDEESRTAAGADGPEWMAELRATWRESMSSKVRNALERLGEEIFESSEVSWPRVEGDDGETESFQWFVSNAKAGPQGKKTLGPIQQRDWPRLPVLRPAKDKN